MFVFLFCAGGRGIHLVIECDLNVTTGVNIQKHLAAMNERDYKVLP